MIAVRLPQPLVTRDEHLGILDAASRRECRAMMASAGLLTACDDDGDGDGWIETLENFAGRDIDITGDFSAPR